VAYGGSWVHQTEDELLDAVMAVEREEAQDDE
jgi:hypothetical protein